MRIGNVLKKWRVMSELDLRQGAKVLGLGHSTLFRIESGKVPDGETLIKLMAWLFGEDAANGEATNTDAGN